VGSAHQSYDEPAVRFASAACGYRVTVDSPHARMPFAVAVALAVLCGVGVATQSRINGELSQQLGNGPVAALISFGSGFVIIAAIAFIAPTARRGTRILVRDVRNGSFPWVFLLGGLIGGLFVLSQGLAAGILGVALFTVAVVAGQSVSGTLLDRRGLGTMAPRPITWNRVVGAALALAAVVFAVSSQLRGDVPWVLMVLPFVAGLGLAWQQGVNGQVGQRSGSVITATFNNFVFGTAALVIVVLIWTIWSGWPTVWPTEPWLYLGGVVGCIFIGIGALVVRRVGTLLLGLCTIAGQLVTSVALDAFLPIPGHTLTVSAVVGAAVALVAVAIASIPRRTDGDGVRASSAVVPDR
jgi:transporter family-2 protein